MASGPPYSCQTSESTDRTPGTTQLDHESTYAPLFNPSTPPASPILKPVDLPADTCDSSEFTSVPTSDPTEAHSDSEFGSFVDGNAALPPSPPSQSPTPLILAPSPVVANEDVENPPGPPAAETGPAAVAQSSSKPSFADPLTSSTFTAFPKPPQTPTKPTSTNPLLSPLASPLVPQPRSGVRPAQMNSNLVDEIMKYEKNPLSLFSQSTKPAEEQEDLDVTTPTTRTSLTTSAPSTSATIGTQMQDPLPSHTSAAPTLDSFDPLSNASSSNPQSQPPPVQPMTVALPSSSSASKKPAPPTLSGREPAEAIPIVTTPAAVVSEAKKGLSTTSGPSVPLPQTSTTAQDATTAASGTPNPSHSPTWSFRSLLSSGFSSPTSSRAHTRAPSLQGISFGGYDQPRIAQSLPTPHPLDLPTPVNIPRAEGDATHWRDEDGDGDEHGEMMHPRRASSFNTLGSWVGSFLWSENQDPSQQNQPVASRPRSRSRPRSHSRSYSPEDRRTGHGHHLGPPPVVSSPSPISSPEPPQSGPVQGQGRMGRPLPRARPSLESIQQLYTHHPSHGHQGHLDPHLEDKPTPQEVTITHSTPFAPPPPTSSAFLAAGAPSSLNTGFSGGGPFGGSSFVGSSTVGKGDGNKTNPFASHSFVPVEGAPGFKPDEYDWDKGHYEELEKELDGAPSKGGEVSRGRTQEKEGGGFGSRFSFGPFRRKTSADRVPSNTVGRGRTHTEPPSSKLEVPSYATVRGGNPSPSRRVPDLIERKFASVTLKGRNEGTDVVLKEKLAELIRPHLPPLSRLPKTWTLLYSLDQHGISLNTLYNNCETPERNRKRGEGYIGMGGAVLVVKDSLASENQDGDLFGAFVAEGLGKKSKGFFGGGDSFLWKYADGQLKVFKATGKNTYFAICNKEYMAFGGGSTSYGLYLDSGLFQGSSAPCPTFGNEVLCTIPFCKSRNDDTTSSSSFQPTLAPGLTTKSTLAVGDEVDFECVGLEVWGVGP
ncbi:oxidation resistance protein 1 [Coprinopsis cinerea okayama7|uniref:Oxidation resistance protein 1 n=1 Tax=Coprinopsis cinerea (strain Okayama-7 / 130 / ATCC MYA-4618 / FGSC 9003) TaxID=240176 RepID=A8NKT6_COPC7|nr:oxidation resistance protein 1 [Coprinopsis cinerea okayama7\|eukprot:XP_001834541.2 oxidation resistance protein 1 [Coprinopsis cinerea okayama7\